MKKINFLVATVASAVSGALIGMLFAPDKGRKTRKKLKKEGEEYLKAIRKEIEQKRKELNEQAEKTKKRAQESASEFRNDAKKRGDELVKRAKKLTSYDEWTKDELYERAKQLGIDSYSTMNKEELINALRNR